MFEFNKLCNEMEKLSPAERSVLLAEKSFTVIKGLKALNVQFDPIKTLVTFIIGSAVSDGAINEKDYLYIYPSLTKAFGEDFDFLSAKQTLALAKDIQKEITKYTKDLMSAINLCDENLSADIISLCLLVTSIDGKISLKEKRYIKKLCRA